MAQATLHYFHDPLCGWCYAAEPLVRAASVAPIDLRLHGGGLWDPPSHVLDAKRADIKSNDRRIEALTGQVFGTAYLDGLLDDPGTVFHSRPTIAAILAAERCDPQAGLSMLASLQRAHYVDGRRIVYRDVLIELGRGLGLKADDFAASLEAVPVDEHIEGTRATMRRHGARGFPTFLLEQDGVVARLEHETFYGRPDAFAARLSETVARSHVLPLRSTA